MEFGGAPRAREGECAGNARACTFSLLVHATPLKTPPINVKTTPSCFNAHFHPTRWILNADILRMQQNVFLWAYVCVEREGTSNINGEYLVVVVSHSSTACSFESDLFCESIEHLTH